MSKNLILPPGFSQINISDTIDISKDENYNRYIGDKFYSPKILHIYYTATKYTGASPQQFNGKISFGPVKDLQFNAVLSDINKENELPLTDAQKTELVNFLTINKIITLSMVGTLSKDTGAEVLGNFKIVYSITI